VTLDCPFQAPRPVLHVHALVQQEILRRLCHAEKKSPFPRLEHSVLHHSQFNLQYPAELFVSQGMEHYSLVDAVYEFGREPAQGWEF
jgi:hypothetical protein